MQIIERPDLCGKQKQGGFEFQHVLELLSDRGRVYLKFFLSKEASPEIPWTVYVVSPATGSSRATTIQEFLCPKDGWEAQRFGLIFCNEITSLFGQEEIHTVLLRVKAFAFSNGMIKK